ncbi:MAG: hypothetical protein J6C41_08125 [Oscillospiraceae bacterium]|nr:hypothetical protein [Oscillospiraceae bacterium]
MPQPGARACQTWQYPPPERCPKCRKRSV